MTDFHATADAASEYSERTGVNIAQSASTAQDGTLASFSRNNVLVYGKVSLRPGPAPTSTTHVIPVVEVVELDFVQDF